MSRTRRERSQPSALSSSAFLTCCVAACPVLLGLQGFWDPSTAEAGDLVPDLKTTIMPPEMSCSFVSGDSSCPCHLDH
jgi:hypothetical protein